MLPWLVVLVCLLLVFEVTKLILCSEIAKHLKLPPVKLHCSIFAEDAIKAAVKDYEAKRASATAATGDKSATAWFLLLLECWNDDEKIH